MFPDLVPIESSARATPLARHAATPALFSHSERAERRFWEFFTAHIRNPNTRHAYLAAVRRFAEWCDRRGLALDQVEPVVVAAYVEQLTRALSPATVKQHLAALRMLLDWLVFGQVLPFNPANSVRGPRHVVKAGKTPVLFAEENLAFLRNPLRQRHVGRRPAQVRFRRNARFRYVYDMFCEWEHELRVEERLSADAGKHYPRCIGGAGACPPEDCGGPDAYHARRDEATGVDAMDDLALVADTVERVLIGKAPSCLDDDDTRWRLERAVDRLDSRARFGKYQNPWGPTARPSSV